MCVACMPLVHIQLKSGEANVWMMSKRIRAFFAKRRQARSRSHSSRVYRSKCVVCSRLCVSACVSLATWITQFFKKKTKRSKKAMYLYYFPTSWTTHSSLALSLSLASYSLSCYFYKFLLFIFVCAMPLRGLLRNKNLEISQKANVHKHTMHIALQTSNWHCMDCIVCCVLDHTHRRRPSHWTLYRIKDHELVRR